MREFELMDIEIREEPDEHDKITLENYNTLKEALEEIVERDPSYTNPTDIAKQALGEVE